MRVTIDPAVRAIVRPAVLLLGQVTVRDADTGLDAALAALEHRLRTAPPAGGDAVRAMYRRLGIDPTKTRPSSEALLRRVVKGGPLPRVNTAVDVCNWCSVEFQLPYGLYDADRLRGDLALRRGREGEEYAGIRKDVVHVAGRLTLADADGPFGNPTSDSARSMVGPGASRLLLVVYAPAGTGDARLAEVLDTTAARYVEHCGGVLEDRAIL